MTPAGDVNGDGLADLFITTGVTYMTWPAADWRHEYGSDAGPAAYLLYGSAERPSVQGVAPLSDFAVAFRDRDDIGRDVTDELFYKTVSLNAIGDSDGDGFDDFTLTTSVLADPKPDQDPTRVDLEPRGSATFLFYGQSQPFSADPALQRSSAKLAGVVAAEPLGDVDGDELADALLIGDDPRILPGASERRSGDVSVDVGVPIVGVRLHPEVAGPSAIGDLDQDGYDDFLLRDSRFDGDSSDLHGLYSYLVHGGPGLLDGERLGPDDASATFDPHGSGSLAPAGDWDADGNPDLLFLHNTFVEGHPYGEVAHGELLLLRGGASRFSGALEAPVRADGDGPGMGLELSSPARLGDIDGDGFADLSVAAVSPAGRFRAFVKYGSPVLLPPIR